MSRKTDGEKIYELTITVAALTERLNALRAQVKKILTKQDKFAEEATEVKTSVVLLQQQFTDFKNRQEEVGKKRWSLLPPIGGALVNAVLAALIAYFIARR
jgi:predicted  nucleic acid-binding Zn-ribbon protein